DPARLHVELDRALLEAGAPMALLPDPVEAVAPRRERAGDIAEAWRTFLDLHQIDPGHEAAASVLRELQRVAIGPDRHPDQHRSVPGPLGQLDLLGCLLSRGGSGEAERSDGGGMDGSGDSHGFPYRVSFRYVIRCGRSASGPSLLSLSSSYDSKLPSNHSTWLSPSKARMWVARRSRKKRSWLMTTAQPAKLSNASSRARRVSTSRSLVGSSRRRTLP